MGISPDGDVENASERRPSAADRSGPREYVFAGFRVNIPYCQLFRDEQLVPLKPKAFDTLVYLISHRDHVVSKDELLAAVWPDSFVSEDALSQNIWAIRRALGDDPDKQEFIATVPRRGYRFIPAVVETAADPAVDAAAEGVHRESVSDPETSARQTTHDGHGIEAGGALESADGVSARVADGVRGAVGRRSWYAVVVAAVLVAAAWVVMESQRSNRVSDGPTGQLRFTQPSPAGATLVSGGVLSPDGQQLAFVAEDERTGKTQVWLRKLDAAEPRPLPGTDGASRPFWSTDGQYIGFFADSMLKRVGLSGDEPRTLAPIVGIRVPTASWGSNDLILFSSSSRAGLSAVPASGGTPRPVTTLNSATRDIGHQWPYFLPDGQHFLFTIVSEDADRSGIYVGKLDSSEPPMKVLDAAIANAIYAPQGYLLYVRGGLLMAHPFDESALRLTGDALTIAGNVRGPGVLNDTVLSVSADGLLTFGGDTASRRLLWIDRAGNHVGEFNASLVNLSFSPDGRQVIGNSASPNGPGGGVWLLDLARGVPTQIVPNGGTAMWAPDGSRIAYVVQASIGQLRLQFKSIRDAVKDEVSLESARGLYLNAWSPDDRYLIYAAATEGKQNLWLMSTTEKAKTAPYASTHFNQIQGQVSPDGQTLAYASDESGTWEVYVDSFPVPGNKRRISFDGGAQPQWARSGSELFYLALDRQMMRVGFDGREAARPQPLFKAPVLGSLTNYLNHYAVSPDGRRFLISASTGEPITILFNWIPPR